MKWMLLVIAVLVGFLVFVVLAGLLLPQAHTASRSIKLKQTPEDVWRVITGPPDWRPEVRSYQELAQQHGNRVWRETDTHGQTITYEVTESTPPRRLVSRIADAKLPFGGTWTYELAPTHEGCSLTITENGQVYNPVYRFVSRFIIGHTATIDAYLKALERKLG